MRVSDNLTISNITANIQRAQVRLLNVSTEASTGVRIGTPSDDPIGTSQFNRLQSAIDAATSHRGAVSSVKGDLEIAESTLASAYEVMARAREIALQGANGAMDADSRQALALEVGQLRDQMLALANQKGSSGYLFGGTASLDAPFDPAGLFIGNDQDRVAQIGPREVMVVSVSGAQAFTSAAGGRDVLADLEALQASLAADSQAGILATVNSMEAGQRQILAARADAGLRVSRLDIADSALADTQLSLTSQRSDVADAEPAEAYTRLVAAQGSLERAIAASKTVLSSLGKGW